MILKMYALKDELNGFTPPIPFMSEELAKRYLSDQTQENPTIRNNPEDFSLYYVGSYDSETALISQNGQPELIERAKTYGNTKNNV